MTTTNDNLLSDIKVLDLSQGVAGPFCGKLLAGFGAEVIKVEPPGAGDSSRSSEPFLSGSPTHESSALFAYINTSKKSVTLDPAVPKQAQAIKRLAQDCDILVESFPPGHLDSLGLGYGELSESNPDLIYVSVTPFGQTGPWSGYQSSDLISVAASGFMQITGDPDGPPLRQGNEQSHFPGAQYAAAAIMGALFYRDMQDGQGQYVDVSMQEAMITYYTDAHPALAWMQRSENVTRVGTNSTLVIPLGAYPSSDGWISAGIITPREWDNLSQWMYEVTGNEEILNDDYKGGNQDRAPFNDIITALVIDFTTRFTSEELFHQGQERNLVFIPVNTVSDLLIDPQLEASNFWFDLHHADAGTLKYPLGVFDSEEVSPRTKPAPHLGQDNQAILGGELGLSDAELSSLRSQGAI